jgi:hypothetical protein
MKIRSMVFPGLLITCLLTCLVLSGQAQTPEKQDNATAPKIVLQPKSLDLGKIKQGTIKSIELGLINGGEGTLEIRQVQPSCGCTAALVSKKSLAPGEKGIVSITFNSTNFRGKVEKHVAISSNDPATPYVDFAFTAEIEPAQAEPAR